jgi:chromosome segregation ATPase
MNLDDIKQENEYLRKDILNLKSKVRSLEDENNLLQIQTSQISNDTIKTSSNVNISSLQEKLEEKDNKIMRLTMEIEKYCQITEEVQMEQKAVTEEMKAQLCDYQNSRDAMEKELAYMQQYQDEKMMNYTDEIACLQQEVSSLHKELVEKETHIQRLAGTNSNSDNLVNKARESQATSDDDKSRQIKSLQEQLMSTLDKIAKSSLEKECYRKEMEDLQCHSKETEKKIRALERELASVKATSDKLQKYSTSDVTLAGSESDTVKSLQQLSKEKDAQLCDLKEKTEECLQQICKLEACLCEMEQQCCELQHRNACLQEELACMNEKLEEAKYSSKSAAGVNSDASKMESESLKRELCDKEYRINDLHKQISELSMTMNEMQKRTKSNSNDTSSEFLERIAMLEAQSVALKARLMATEEENAQCRNEMEDKLQCLECELNMKEEVIAQLQAKINENK